MPAGRPRRRIDPFFRRIFLGAGVLGLVLGALIGWSLVRGGDSDARDRGPLGEAEAIREDAGARADGGSRSPSDEADLPPEDLADLYESLPPSPVADPGTTGEGPDRSDTGRPDRSGAAGGDPAGINREGLALFRAGEYGRAARRFRAAVDADPGVAEYRNNLGWSLFLSGDLAGAEAELRTVVSDHPQRLIAFANLGEVLWRLGDQAGAIAAYREFLSRNDDVRRDSIARGRLARIQEGVPNG